MSAVQVSELIAQLRVLGVTPGGVLLVHTAFTQVRPVAGGPLGLIQALRGAVGPEGTLVMPTMTAGERIFDPRSTPTLDMGVTAESFWRLPGVLRSDHPGASFAAEGPAAPVICGPQPLAPPHGPESPVGRVHTLGGQILLLGVDHSESTTLHLAEALAAVPYSVSHPCVVEVEGAAEVVQIPETDHCCENFRKVGGWLRARGLQAEGSVGWGRGILARSQDVVAVAMEALAADPLVFLCAADAECAECDLARGSV